MSQERWTINTCPWCKKLLTTWPPENACQCEPPAIGSPEPGHLQVEVVPARALEAALEEARRYEDALKRIVNTYGLVDCDSVDDAVRYFREYARSALVSGGRDGE